MLSLKMIFRLLILGCILLFPKLVLAVESEELELSNGDVIGMDFFQADVETLVIWIPSERGLGNGYHDISQQLELLGVDVWAVKLHESLFLSPGRRSLDEVDGQALTGLLAQAKQQGFNKVFILSSSRGALLSLSLSHFWQQDHPDQSLLSGFVFFSPHFIPGSTEIGSEADYHELTRHVNLPVYLIQAERSTKFARFQEISELLATGGSAVYRHILPDVSGGFHMRHDDDLTAQDIKVRDQLGSLISVAVKLMQQTPAASFERDFKIRKADAQTIGFAETLKPFKGDPKPAPLQLHTLKGEEVTLEALKGQVVLVNFWATWCAPCVEEIPSLQSLQDKLQPKGFKVLAINIGETPTLIDEFKKQVSFRFDVVMDPQSQAVRDWKVYAYPSNFLLDRNGLIKYAYRGALQWDSPQVVDIIESLL